jgi:hypothetical protein
VKDKFNKFRNLLKRAKRKIQSMVAEPEAPTQQPSKPQSNVIPDWAAVINSDSALWNRLRMSNCKKVLVANAIGGNPVIVAMESLIAMGLAARGADVHVLLCDKSLPACLRSGLVDFESDPQEFVKCGPQKRLCDSCFAQGSSAFEHTGLKIQYLSDYLTAEDKEEASRLSNAISVNEVRQFQYKKIAVGEHAMAGALRYFARGTISGEPDGEAVLRRYLEASILTVKAMSALMHKEQFECVAMNHGIYVPHGPMSEVVNSFGKRVVTWCLAYRKKCAIFSHDDTYHHTLISEPTAVWEDIEWSDDLEREIMDYLKSRWTGSKDWIWFHEHPEANPEKISNELGIDFSKPTIGLLTNVVWDAQLHYPANAFSSMLEWLTKTIEYFKKRPDLQLIIRVHPAEIRGTVPSRQLAVDEIAKAFPTLPENVFVIPPESSASTYAVMLQCDAAIIYGTKTGLELTSMGIPTVVAGEAWIRNKGITMDAHSESEYFEILDRLPLSQRRLSPEITRRARMYAYHFFFRRMIPLKAAIPQKDWPPLKIEVASLSELLPGSDDGLDTVCSGILDGTPFVYEAEKLATCIAPALGH